MELSSVRTRDVPAQYIETPVFLIGSERSGTTLLRLMLDHHPHIAFNLESEFLVSEVSDTGVFPDVAGYRRTLLRDRVFAHSGFTVREDLNFLALANDFLRQKLERDRKQIVGATVHFGFSRLRHLWPRAKYIYLFRDGRDVASSVVEMGWAGNVFVGAKWWLEAEREWEEFQKCLLLDRWIEVRYEDLVAAPEAQLRRICEFVGVGFSERMFDYVDGSNYDLPDASQTSKWRRKIKQRDLELLEARIGSRLAARGYELVCEAPPQISRAGAEWLYWRSQLNVLRFKIQMFGLRLFAVEVISRRLKLTGIHSRAQDAINLIIDQNLK